ncbi:MAG: hypothetical protein R2827_05185 [Bdellovibrionales bacterium]
MGQFLALYPYCCVYVGGFVGGGTDNLPIHAEEIMRKQTNPKTHFFHKIEQKYIKISRMEFGS